MAIHKVVWLSRKLSEVTRDRTIEFIDFLELYHFSDPSLKVEPSLLLLTDSMTCFCVHNLFNQFRVRARFHCNGKMWAKLSSVMSVYSAVCQSWDLFQQQKTKSRIKKTKGYFKTEINVGIINIKALSKTLIPPCCHVTCHVVTDIDKERLR